MAENLVLGVFLVLPIVFGWLFTRFMRAKQLVPANLALTLAFVFLGLLGAEIYYRFIRDTTDSFGLTRASQVWFKRHYEFNQAGFRDSAELVGRRPPGKRRVTFIGDSFTAGHGIADVEARFPNRIREAHPDWDVNVLAANGLDTGAELGLLREAVVDKQLELDQVVLVYVLNDISDIVPEWQAILRRIYALKPSPLIDHSYFLNLVYYRTKAARDPGVSRYYDSVIGAYEGPIWAQQAARLREFAAVVRENGGALRVVTFPFIQAIGPDYPYRSVHERLDAFWREQGVPHLDLLTIYGPLRARDLVVNSQDAHPNAVAHAMAAEAVGDFVAQHLGD